MKNIYLLLTVCFIFFESKAQFNEAKYDSYEEFSSRNQKIKFYIVKLNNKWGIVDIKGKELIPIEFDNIEDIYDGVNDLERLVYLEKDNYKGVLNLNNKYVVPLSNWISIYETGSFICAVKKGPVTTQSNTYNSRMDTTYLYMKTGDLLMATDYHYDFNAFLIDTCLTKNLYFTAEKTNADDYYDGDYDFFIIKKGQQPKMMFEYSNVKLWPDKMFYVEKHKLKIKLSERLSEPKAFFSTMEGEIITTKGDYTEICCKTMYPRYEAVEYGKFNEQRNRYEEGLTYIIDTAGNKLSEGYSYSTIIGKTYYEEDGYFFKIFDGTSITPLCSTLTLKSGTQNNSNVSKNKSTSIVKKEDSFVRINSFDRVKVSAKKFVDKDYIQSYIDFNGNNITGWYKRIDDLPGKYYDKSNNSVYNGGNLQVSRKAGDEEKLLHGIFNMVVKKEILPIKYDGIYFFNDGVYRLKLKDKFGLWFQKEDILIEPIYDEIDEYPNRVKFDGKWGKIEKAVFIPF
jgi:hypothetical protein